MNFHFCFHLDTMSLLKLGRLNPSRSLLLLCDMQDKFANSTSHFNEIVETSGRLATTANLLQMNTLITEHYPKGKQPNKNYK